MWQEVLWMLLYSEGDLSKMGLPALFPRCISFSATGNIFERTLTCSGWMFLSNQKLQ